MSDVTYIEKKDSKKEVFSYDKLIASILKTGVPMENAKQISDKITLWVKESSKKGNVKSNEIRNKVIDELSNDFPSEADSYQVYVKG